MSQPSANVTLAAATAPTITVSTAHACTVPAPISSSSASSSNGGIRQCTLSAAHHQHDGPIYASVLEVMDGIATIEFVDLDGYARTLDIADDMIDTGRHVDHALANGRVDEIRFRCYCILFEDDATGSKFWRCCQVERVVRSGSGYKVLYRLRNAVESLELTLSQFLRKVVKCTPDAYLVGLGDGADGSLSLSEIKSAIGNQAAFFDARRGCADDMVVSFRSPIGFQTTKGVSHIPKHPHVECPRVTDSTVSDPTPESVTAIVRFPPTLQDDSLDGVAPAGTYDNDDDELVPLPAAVSNDDLNVMMGGSATSGKPVVSVGSPSHDALLEAARYSRKNEYHPCMTYQERERVIFNDNSEFKRRGKSLGDKLDSILSVERSKTPGVNIGHADMIMGFGVADQPLGTCLLGGTGCGTLRTVQEANKNKAVSHAHQKNDCPLNTLDQVSKVTLYVARVFTRWYRFELVECAIFLDQFVRDAIEIEGSWAHQAIVNSYVVLIEGAFAELGRALAEMLPSTYPALIGAAVKKFRVVLDIASPEFAHSVGIARRIAASSLPPTRHSRGIENKPHRAMERNAFPAVQRKQDRPDKRARPLLDSPHRPLGRIPGWVLSTLKDSAGKTICGQHALRNGCRTNGCRYLHVPAPSNLPQAVTEWIRANAPIQDRQ